MVVVVLLTIASGLYVQHAFTNTQIRTIKDVAASDTEGGTVVVRGKIIYAVENVFILDDGTGKAELSTCPTWYKRIQIREGDQVTVVGQVMVNPPMNTKVNFALSVYKIIHGGETIEVRRRPGKPPWTSYPAPAS